MIRALVGLALAAAMVAGLMYAVEAFSCKCGPCCPCVVKECGDGKCK